MYDRLTSRKLLLCLTSVALAIWGHHAGIIDGDRMMTAISVAVTAYTAAEGVSDAAAAWRSKPSAPDQVVNVDAASTQARMPTAAEIARAMLEERAAQLRERYPAGPADPDPLISKPPEQLPPTPRYG